MSEDELFNNYFNIIAHYDLIPMNKKGDLKFYLNYLFSGVSFKDKSVLEIGGGNGLISLYGAFMGAKSVVLLEPESKGSTNGVLDKLDTFDNVFLQNRIKYKATTFQNFNPNNQIFDIIILHNSINHLDEEACINLMESNDAREIYGDMFKKLSELSAINAKLVIADCSRYNFWDFIGLVNPIASTIEWHKHQSPKYWSQMLYDFGFINPKIRWTSPKCFRELGRLFLGNRFVSYFTSSHFCLVMNHNHVVREIFS